MFVRIKKNPTSPRKSVQIVHSYRVGKKVRQKIIKHIGVAENDKELEELQLFAHKIKLELENKNAIFSYSPEELSEMANKSYNKQKEERDKKNEEADAESESKNDKTEEKRYNVNLLDLKEVSRQIKGIHDIYGKLYEDLGFNKVLSNRGRNVQSNKILKNIVLARIANPLSKRKSRDNLENNFGVKLNLESIYKMMNKLDTKAIERLQKIAHRETKSLFKDKIDVLYFDATTLYFESFKEDELREKGYSKNNKHQETQVVLALLVTKQGLPIGYKLFPGSTFDGHTLLPTLEELNKDFEVDKAICVADSGMFSKKNLEELEKYKRENQEGASGCLNLSYIVGCRIKNLRKDLKDKILNIDDYRELNEDLKIKTMRLENGKKLLVSYSKKRAKKDKADREKAVEKLQEQLSKSKSLKSQLSNKGYRKYLEIEGGYEGANKCKLSIVINEKKLKEEEKWDGLKGIVTNDDSLSEEELLHQYSNLWQIEESFRISKHDLKIRPIYHFKKERIEAHIAICFMAYTLVRHLEYRVRLMYKKLSIDKIREILSSVQVSLLENTKNSKKYLFPSNYSKEAKKIYKIMGVEMLNRACIVEK